MKPKKCKEVKAQVINIKSDDECKGCCNCTKKSLPITKIIGCNLKDDIITESTDWNAIICNIQIIPKKSLSTLSLSANGTGNSSYQATVFFRIVVNDCVYYYSAAPQSIYNNGSTIINMWNISLNTPICLDVNKKNCISIEWSIDNSSNNRYAKINSMSDPMRNNFSYYIQYQ